MQTLFNSFFLCILTQTNKCITYYNIFSVFFNIKIKLNREENYECIFEIKYVFLIECLHDNKTQSYFNYHTRTIT